MGKYNFWFLKGFSILLILLSNVIFYNRVIDSDELKLIQVVLERAYLLPNSATQWSGDALATVICFFLYPFSIPFPNLFPDLTYLFLDQSSQAVSLFRLFTSFILILIISLSNKRDEIITFTLFTIFLFAINQLCNFQLGIISSYLFILILTRNKVNFYGPLIIGLKALYVYPLLSLQLGRKTKYNYWFILLFTLVCYSSLISYPHLVIKSFFGDIYLKLTGSKGIGKDLMLIGVNVISIFPVIYSIFKSRSGKRYSIIIVQILMLLLYCKVAAFGRYMYPLIAWTIFITMNNSGLRKLWVLCVVPFVIVNYQISSFNYTGREMLIKSVKVKDKAKKKATFIPNNQFFSRLLSDEDSNEWFLNNFPEKK